MKGVFGSMILTLSLSGIRDFKLCVDLNKGEAKGLGTKYLQYERVYREDLLPMLRSVEMFNSLPNGFGKMWRFDVVGGLMFNEKHEWVPGNFSFFVNMVGQKKVTGYSQLGFEKLFRPSYQGGLFLSTIERKIDKEAIVYEEPPLKDPEISYAHIDTVTYLRERNCITASLYCPEMSTEEVPRPVKIPPKTWWEA